MLDHDSRIRAIAESPSAVGVTLHGPGTSLCNCEHLSETTVYVESGMALAAGPHFFGPDPKEKEH